MFTYFSTVILYGIIVVMFVGLTVAAFFAESHGETKDQRNTRVDRADWF